MEPVACLVARDAKGAFDAEYIGVDQDKRVKRARLQGRWKHKVGHGRRALYEGIRHSLCYSRRLGLFGEVDAHDEPIGHRQVTRHVNEDELTEQKMFERLFSSLGRLALVLVCAP